MPRTYKLGAWLPPEVYYAADPKKYARNAARVAVDNGTLKKGPCVLQDETCKGGIQAHHDSYEIEHWLHVTWLCASHHQRHHRDLKSEPAPGFEPGTARLRIGCSTTELSRRKMCEKMQPLATKNETAVVGEAI